MTDKNEARILETKTERTFSVKEAAEACGLSDVYISNQIRDGAITASKDEKSRWQIKQSDLDKYLASKSVKPRKSAKFTAVAGDSGKSLATLLDDEKTAHENLKTEHAAAKLKIETLEKAHKREIEILKQKNADQAADLNAEQRRCDNLQLEIESYKDQIADHNKFLRDMVLNLVGTNSK